MDSRAPRSVHILASLLVVLYLGGLGVALAMAAPWQLASGASYIPVSVAPLGATVDVPIVIADDIRDVSSDAGPAVTWGATDTAPVAVGIKVSRFEVPLASATLETQAAAALVAFRSGLEDGLTFDASLERQGDTVVVEGIAERPDGLLCEKVFRISRTELVETESLIWPKSRTTWRGVARRVAESVEFQRE